MPTIQKKAAPAATAATAAGTPATAPGANGPRFGSVRHDLMVNTGLANNFWGTIERVRYAPRRYGEKSGDKAGKYFLSANIVIRADDPEVGKNGIVEDFMRVGDLDQWVPSDASGVPVGLTLADYKLLASGQGQLPNDNDVSAYEGVYALGVGTQENPPNSTKWNQWGAEITKAGFKLEWQGINVDCFEGTRAYWTRIPFASKGGGKKLELGPGQNEPQVLVAAELDMEALEKKMAGGGSAGSTVAAKKAAVAPKPAVAPKASTPAPAPAPAGTPNPGTPTADLDAQLEALILEALAGADEEDLGDGVLGRTLHKTQLGALISTAFADDKKSMMAAVLKAGKADWLGADERKFAYDPEQELLVLVSE